MTLRSSHTIRRAPNSYGLHSQWFSAGPALGDVPNPAGAVYLAEGGVVLQSTMTNGPSDWTWNGACHWEVQFPYLYNAATVNANYSNTSQTYYPRRPWPNHNEGTNCGFVDGHVKWIKTAALVGAVYGAADCVYDNQ